MLVPITLKGKCSANMIWNQIKDNICNFPDIDSNYRWFFTDEWRQKNPWQNASKAFIKKNFEITNQPLSTLGFFPPTNTPLYIYQSDCIEMKILSSNLFNTFDLVTRCRSELILRWYISHRIWKNTKDWQILKFPENTCSSYPHLFVLWMWEFPLLSTRIEYYTNSQFLHFWISYFIFKAI